MHIYATMWHVVRNSRSWSAPWVVKKQTNVIPNILKIQLFLDILWHIHYQTYYAVKRWFLNFCIMSNTFVSALKRTIIFSAFTISNFLHVYNLDFSKWIIRIIYNYGSFPSLYLNLLYDPWWRFFTHPFSNYKLLFCHNLFLYQCDFK